MVPVSIVISSGGMCFLLGGYVYQETRCTVTLERNCR